MSIKMPKKLFQEGLKSTILCPRCTPPPKLEVRTNGKTKHQFLGCPNWPDCNHTAEIPESWKMELNNQPKLF